MLTEEQLKEALAKAGPGELDERERALQASVADPRREERR